MRYNKVLAKILSRPWFASCEHPEYWDTIDRHGRPCKIAEGKEIPLINLRALKLAVGRRRDALENGSTLPISFCGNPMCVVHIMHMGAHRPDFYEVMEDWVRRTRREYPYGRTMPPHGDAMWGDVYPPPATPDAVDPFADMSDDDLMAALLNGEL